MNGIKWGVISPVTTHKNAIIIASGPSVKNIDLKLLERFKDKFYIVTVNGAGQQIPFANAWFTLDPWGLNGPQLPSQNSKCKLYAAVPDDYGTPHARAIAHRVTPKEKITFLHRLQSHNYTSISSDTAYKLGLSNDPSCISTGNSGYGALNLLYHMQIKNIYLLGIDGTVGYFYKSSKVNRPLTYLPTLFASSVNQLKEDNFTVTNVNPVSTVQAFPKISHNEFHDIIQKL